MTNFVKTQIRGKIMENKDIFHERLTELMIEKGLNTVSLAAAIGVSDETVRRWKNGQRDILLSQLAKVADYFIALLIFWREGQMSYWIIK